MGFQEPRSAISICNKALSRIMQQPLSGSLDDPANANKQAARECNLWYKTIVRQVLTSHHFGLATKRVALVESTNDRAGEWLAAYVPPSDMAFPVTMGPFNPGAVGISYYTGVGFILASLYGKPLFRYESGVIYSLISGATLDYVSFNITEQDFNEAVEALIVLFLASVLARSIAKNEKMGQDLHSEAMQRMNLEIARSLNEKQPRYDNFMSDAEMARNGYDPGLLPFGTVFQ